jgi:hypothetical protein
LAYKGAVKQKIVYAVTGLLTRKLLNLEKYRLPIAKLLAKLDLLLSITAWDQFSETSKSNDSVNISKHLKTLLGMLDKRGTVV